CAPHADPARQPSAEIAVGDATQQLRDAEGGPVGDHGEVAHQRHDEPAALTGTVDGHEHDLRAALELHEGRQIDTVGLPVERRAALVSATHLAADAEVLAGPGEHQHVDLRIALGQDRRLLDPVVHLDGAGVASLGTVDDHAQHAAVFAATQMAGPEVDRRRGGCLHGAVLAAAAPRPPAITRGAVLAAAPAP